MHVPEMFSDHGMFMFLYALMEMAASVSNIFSLSDLQICLSVTSNLYI